MAFKTFAPGVLTSSDVNTFLMRQAVITCTSSTRPSSPSEGMTIYETDTNEYRIYDGSAWDCFYKPWTSYTPALTGTGWTFGSETITGTYTRFGRMCEARILIEWAGGITPGAGALSVSIPVAAADTTNRGIQDGTQGQISWIDDSTSKIYAGVPTELRNSPLGVYLALFFQDGDEILNNFITSTAISGGQFVPFDSGDVCQIRVIYAAEG